MRQPVYNVDKVIEDERSRGLPASEEQAANEEQASLSLQSIHLLSMTRVDLKDTL